MAAHTTKSYDQKTMPSALSSVAVRANTQPQQRLIGEQFKNSLQDLIHPGMNENGAETYTLSVSLNPITNPGLIAPDGKAQRYLVTLSSSYVLTRNVDGKIIEQGVMNRNSSYSNLPNSYYSTYIAEQDTLKRLNQELAEQYRMKLVSILSAPPDAPSEMPTALPPSLQTLEPNATFNLQGIQP